MYLDKQVNIRNKKMPDINLVLLVKIWQKTGKFFIDYLSEVFNCFNVEELIIHQFVPHSISYSLSILKL